METNKIAFLLLGIVALTGFTGLLLNLKSSSQVTGDYVYWSNYRTLKNGGFDRVGQVYPQRYNYMNKVAVLAEQSDAAVVQEKNAMASSQY